MKTEETNDKAAMVAEQGAHVAPAKAPSKKGASRKKGAPKAKKGAKRAKAAKAPRAKKGATDARSNKKAEVIAMMKRAKGVTLAEISRDDGLAEAHDARLRQHSGQQGWPESRFVEKRRRGAQLPHREVGQMCNALHI